MKVNLYLPKLEDLWFRKEMLGDNDTMSYNHNYGGTISFLQSDWLDWYDYWIINHDNKRFYRYLVNENNIFIGEIAYHFDSGKCMIDILIHNKYRNKGYGNMGLDILLNVIKENGIKEVYDTIASDNKSITLFLKKDFEIIDKDLETITVKKTL